MPHSYRKTRRSARPIQGRRGQTRRSPKSHTKRKIKSNRSRKNKKPAFSPIRRAVPLQPVGSSVDTIKAAFKLGNKHRKAGRKAKSALYYLLGAAAAGSFGPAHPTVQHQIASVMGDHDRVSGLAADATWTATYGIGRPSAPPNRNTHGSRRPNKTRGKKKRGRRRRISKRGGSKRSTHHK